MSQANIPIYETIRMALVDQQAGRLSQAEALYRAVLATEPEHPDALHLLGVIAQQTGNGEMAIALIGKALSVSPSSQMFCSMGNALAAQGKFDLAAGNYQKAILLNRDDAIAHYNLGNALKDQGKAEAAIEHYRNALSLRPDYAKAHNNLGIVLQASGFLEEAAVSYRAAVAISPADVVAHNNLGNVFHQLGKLDEAVACRNNALALSPDYADAHANLAGTLLLQVNFDAAIQHCRRAIALNPDHAEAHSILGKALCECGDFDEAIASFNKVRALTGESAALYSNVAIVLLAQGKPDEARACYRAAISLAADVNPWIYSNYLMAAQYSDDYSLRELQADHLDYSSRFETPLQDGWPDHLSNRSVKPRLRVGFVSGDLRIHPVGFFLENIVRHLNRDKLDITFYQTLPVEDALTQRLKNMGFGWKSLVGVSDEQAAQCIRDDGIDILVDLSGHTADNRLLVFARKPAPIQVTWLGYFATTGLQAMDYILCDQYVVPDAEAHYFVEKPWRLPDSYLCFTPPAEEVAVGTLPALQNGSITFGCFNNLGKVGESVVALWAQILRSIPGSRLFLKTKQLNSAPMQQATLARFSAHGIGPERLILEGFSPRPDLLASYNRVDIALDPFPFPGGTTSVEALWMGVPVLSLRGDRFLSHVGESILHTAGLPAWVADNHEDYLAKAIAFAGNPESLAVLRQTLRSQLLASPICDAPRFAHNLECAFYGMQDAYLAK